MACDPRKRPMPPSVADLDGTAGGAHRRSQNLDVSAASAKVMAQSLDHIGFGRLGLAKEQCLHAHDHAVETVAALRGLFPDEGVLHRIGPLARAEALQRYDVASDASFDR